MERVMESKGILLTIGLLWGGIACAGAIHDADQFTIALPANDDGSTGAVDIGFSVNFYGNTYSQLYVNNNGNITFNEPLSTYTPFSLLSTSYPMLAPFFADVDTRSSEIVRYGQGVIDGRNVFGVNWIDVGYFPSGVDKLNSFQLIIVDRSDINVGDFDFEFNYDQIQWEAGNASGGAGGLGGSSARVGWSDGVANSYELPGSAVNGAFLDSNAATGLIYNSINSNVPGQYIFQVRNGNTQQPPNVPEPSILILLAGGVLGIRAMRQRKSMA